MKLKLKDNIGWEEIKKNKTHVVFPEWIWKMFNVQLTKQFRSRHPLPFDKQNAKGEHPAAW